MLEHEQAVLRANALDFSLQGRGNLARCNVGDDGDPLRPFQSKTNIDRVARAGNQFRINRMEISAIGHTESCENYAEIQRRQISSSVAGDTQLGALKGCRLRSDTHNSRCFDEKDTWVRSEYLL